MSTTPAKRTEAPVTEWETFDGETIGYNDAGARIVEITARTRASRWASASNVRGWAAMDADHNIVASGEVDGLRAARAAALAALHVDRPAVTPTAPRKGTRVQVNDTYPSQTFVGQRGKVESSARGDDGQLYVTVDLGTRTWPFLVSELDVL